MNSELLLVGILPLILFVIVEIKIGLKAGVWTAIVSAIAAAVYFSLKLGKIDPVIAAEVALIVVLGLISLKFLNDRFIKFQPVLMAAVFAVYAGYLQLSGTPLFIRFGNLINEINPQIGRLLELEVFQNFLADMSLHIIFFFIAHGLLVLWGALMLGSVGWLITRLAFYPMAFIFMAIELMIHPEVAEAIQQGLS